MLFLEFMPAIISAEFSSFAKLNIVLFACVQAWRTHIFFIPAKSCCRGTCPGGTVALMKRKRRGSDRTADWHSWVCLPSCISGSWVIQDSCQRHCFTCWTMVLHQCLQYLLISIVSFAILRGCAVLTWFCDDPLKQAWMDESRLFVVERRNDRWQWHDFHLLDRFEFRPNHKLKMLKSSWGKSSTPRWVSPVPRTRWSKGQWSIRDKSWTSECRGRSYLERRSRCKWPSKAEAASLSFAVFLWDMGVLGSRSRVRHCQCWRLEGGLKGIAAWLLPHFTQNLFGWKTLKKSARHLTKPISLES